MEPERVQTERIASYRDLRVWQDAMSVAQRSDESTRGFPREEAFGMTAQIRRSAASIPANIAEGRGREATGSFVQFLRIAQGSLEELETHPIRSARVGLAPDGPVETLLSSCESLGRQMRALIRSPQRKSSGAGGVA